MYNDRFHSSIVFPVNIDEAKFGIISKYLNLFVAM